MQEVLIKYIEENLLVDQDGEELSAEEDLLGGGLIDSIGIMRLIAFIEEEYNVKVQPQDMTIENFVSVDAMCTYLDRIKAN